MTATPYSEIKIGEAFSFDGGVYIKTLGMTDRFTKQKTNATGILGTSAGKHAFISPVAFVVRKTISLKNGE